MHPNPADGFIVLKDETATSCTISGITGKTIARYENLDGQTQISTKSWPNGLYFLQTDNGLRQKFIVQH